MIVKKSQPASTVDQPVPQPTILTWQQLLLRATGLSLVFVFILLLLTAIGVGIYAYSKVSVFLSGANLSFSEAKQLVETGIHSQPRKTNNRSSFLILGVDSVKNKQDAPPLTDTILLATIDYSTGEVNLLSLPRDLWSEEYKTKINALYYYGIDRYPGEPERFPREVITELTGIPIDYTVVFSLESIGTLVDQLGGLDVDIPHSFIDTEFPREDVDITTTKDPAKLYETVEFKQGVEHMNSERVTKYIRSRHSQGDTGTDVDRAARQQLVISSLLTKMLSKDVITDPSTIANLYNWYGTHLGKFIPMTDAISIAYTLYPLKDSILLISHSISITNDENEGVLEHLPPVRTDNQWTYSIVDKDRFKQEVQDNLY